MLGLLWAMWQKILFFISRHFPFVRTEQLTFPVILGISLLIKNIPLDQSNLNSLYEGDVFQQKRLEKAYFFVKMTCPDMVQPASSDLLKASLVFKVDVHTCTYNQAVL